MMAAVSCVEDFSLSLLFPGVLMLFLTFFAFLHCWLNAFAEMLRFGDRMFYKVLYICSHLFVLSCLSNYVFETGFLCVAVTVLEVTV